MNTPCSQRALMTQSIRALKVFSEMMKSKVSKGLIKEEGCLNRVISMFKFSFSKLQTS